MAANRAANTKAAVNRVGILMPIALAISLCEAAALSFIPHKVLCKITQIMSPTAMPAHIIKRL